MRHWTHYRMTEVATVWALSNRLIKQLDAVECLWALPDMAQF